MSEEYDLKKSEEGIGQLYPILEAKDGEVIDGFHREKANKKWKRIRLEHVDTEEKKLIARLVSNYARRLVPDEEKRKWINGLAEIYEKQGVTSIPSKILEMTGLKKDAVYQHLDHKFMRQIDYPKREPTVSASQVIEKALGKNRPDYGKQIVERHREEVKQELLKSPEFQREVIREISKPQIVKASEPCPSGVCELPTIIKGGKPVDVLAERLELFWKENPNCRCKACIHYQKCGVIR